MVAQFSQRLSQFVEQPRRYRLSLDQVARLVRIPAGKCQGQGEVSSDSAVGVNRDHETRRDRETRPGEAAQDRGLGAGVLRRRLGETDDQRASSSENKVVVPANPLREPALQTDADANGTWSCFNKMLTTLC
ncbi:hypothetical protein [Streptomyces sp. SID13031]|uniref:hypothetical protein n=1 Tax=Streptomyces sp. SID13031 TaxID=2706046 RepID=UPI001EF3399F|nr:hypothetical protein [Streptomyces sp. SID13031]